MLGQRSLHTVPAGRLPSTCAGGTPRRRSRFESAAARGAVRQASTTVAGRKQGKGKETACNGFPYTCLSGTHGKDRAAHTSGGLRAHAAYARAPAGTGWRWGRWWGWGVGGGGGGGWDTQHPRLQQHTRGWRSAGIQSCKRRNGTGGNHARGAPTASIPGEDLRLGKNPLSWPRTR
jgi:hypothetical protein